MANTAVSLYIHIKRRDGTWTFARPVVAGNGRLKPLYALVGGREEKHPEGHYKVSWYEGAKKKFENVGQETDAALAALTRRKRTLEAVAVGVEVKGEGENKTRQTLTSAVAQYLSDTEDTKSKKTTQAYRIALTGFQESCSKTFLDQIEHRDLKPTYIAYLKRLLECRRFLERLRDHRVGWPTESVAEVHRESCCGLSRGRIETALRGSR